jgi:hypothetical protein
MYKLIIKHDMSTWHMKVRVIQVFRVPDCDTRINQNKFGFCKLLPEIPELNLDFGFGFGYSGFGFRVTGFLPSPRWDHANHGIYRSLLDTDGCNVVVKQLNLNNKIYVWPGSQMDYETFSYKNIRHILYINYHGIICSCCNTRALT